MTVSHPSQETFLVHLMSRDLSCNIQGSDLRIVYEGIELFFCCRCTNFRLCCYSGECFCVCWITCTQIYVTKLTVNKMFVGLCEFGAWHIFELHGLPRGIGTAIDYYF